MAEELRWTTLVSTTASTASETNNAIASFQNTTDENIYIRNIDFDGVIVDASPTKTADGYSYVTCQVSKQVAYISTSGDTNWKQNIVIVNGVMDDAASTTLTGTNIAYTNKSFRYAKGQLVLEPNETLYIHDSHTNSSLEVTNQSTAWVIGYHF